MEIKNCEKCTGKETWKPQRAHHCRECGFCIFKMDHHCPWVNNCVGINNHLYFMLFLLSTLSLLLTTFFGVILNYNCHENIDVFRSRENFLFVDLLLPESFYSKFFVMLATWVCLIITGLFMSLVALLFSVQVRNFCLNLTTSERFSGKAKA